MTGGVQGEGEVRYQSEEEEDGDASFRIDFRVSASQVSGDVDFCIEFKERQIQTLTFIWYFFPSFPIVEKKTMSSF